MTDHERNTTVVTSSGGAGWFVAILMLVIVAAGGFYLYQSGAFGGSQDVNVTIDVPTDIVPDAPAN